MSEARAIDPEINNQMASSKTEMDLGYEESQLVLENIKSHKQTILKAVESRTDTCVTDRIQSRLAEMKQKISQKKQNIS